MSAPVSNTTGVVRRIDIAAGILAVMFVAFLVYSFIVRDFAQMTELRGEQMRLTEELTFLAGVADTLGQSKGILADLDKETEQLTGKLPDAMHFEEFYFALAEGARESKVILKSVTPGEVKKVAEYIEMPVTMNLTASYPDFHHFIYSLFTMPRLTKLDFMSISRAPKPHMCNIALVVRIYAARERGVQDGQ